MINTIKGGENYCNRSSTADGGSSRHGGGVHGRGMGGGGGSYRGNNVGSADPILQTPDTASLMKEEANWYKVYACSKKVIELVQHWQSVAGSGPRIKVQAIFSLDFLSSFS